MHSIENEQGWGVSIDGLYFRLTSVFIPEQYDVYKNKRKVGYVRIRGGRWRVDVPYDNAILHGDTGNDEQGWFTDTPLGVEFNVPEPPLLEVSPERLECLQGFASAINCELRRLAQIDKQSKQRKRK